MTPFWSRFLQIRHTLKTLSTIASHLGSIDRQLVRIGDHLCGPEVIPVPEVELRVHSGVSFATDHEQGKILSFVEKFHRDIGREPTEDEVLDFLDGKAG